MTRTQDLPTDFIDEIVAFSGELADAAWSAIAPHFRNLDAIHDKVKAGRYDPVTEGDKASERAIRALIEARYPDHAIVGEEYGKKDTGSRFSWTLDPIDGTRAFVCGLVTWTTLIAFCVDGRPVVGVIDQGYLGERFVGWPGHAVFEKDGQRTPIRTRACASLSEAVHSTVHPFLYEGDQADGFTRLRRATRMGRYSLDAYAYAMLAMGGMDLVLDPALETYDVHALIPVIEGAGGVITDWTGGPAWDGGTVLASGDRALHAKALALLAG